MRKLIFLFFIGIFNCNSQKKEQRHNIESEITEKLSGKEIVSELNKLGFFNLTDESELKTVKQQFTEFKDKRNLFSGTMRVETTDYTDNRFFAVDCETLFETYGLIEYLSKVRPLFEKLGLKFDYKNEKSEQTPYSWKHTIELNGTEYIAFDGGYTEYDWRISYLNFIKILNSELENQNSENRFYPIKCDYDGKMVLLTSKQFDFIKKHFPNNNEHPQKIVDWEKL